jgi:hypothetical protein
MILRYKVSDQPGGVENSAKKSEREKVYILFSQ